MYILIKLVINKRTNIRRNNMTIQETNLVHFNTQCLELFSSLLIFVITMRSKLTFEGFYHAFPHDWKTKGNVVFMGAYFTQKLKLQVVKRLKSDQKYMYMSHGFRTFVLQIAA